MLERAEGRADLTTTEQAEERVGIHMDLADLSEEREDAHMEQLFDDFGWAD